MRSTGTPLLLAALALCSLSATARGSCNESTDLPYLLNFRIDNDVFGQQDQGYSNGMKLTWVSPNLKGYTDDPCLPSLARWINRHLQAVTPAGFDQQNMVIGFSHSLFTPADPSQRQVIPQDRPYAGIWLMSLGYNARRGDHLQTTQLQWGMVGPSALGKQVQRQVHKFVDGENFEGWDNQLRDEPVVSVVHERMRRFAPQQAGIWGWDAIGHYGGSLGTLATHANLGGELRWGRHLPNDFGSTPLRPAGENTAPIEHRLSAQTVGFHLFVTTDVRWVLRDITLDGNTFKNSHRVNKRPFVGYYGYGMALMYRRWKFALARYHSTREFDTQKQLPVFGSFTISRMF